MDESTIPAEGGLSRRELLKRAATVGAAAWAVPIVTTFNAPAFAQSDESPLCTEDWNCGDEINSCGTGPLGFECVCDLTVEGKSFCWNNAFCDVGTFPCSSTAECPPGWGCVTNCCGTYCFPPCGTLASPDMANMSLDSREGLRTGTGR